VRVAISAKVLFPLLEEMARERGDFEKPV